MVKVVVALLLLMVTMVTGQILNGVTILSEPFVYTANNRFSGFCVDLLEMIKEETGYNYSLYLVPDKKYGPGPVHIGHSPNGLIGEVYNRKASFAIADITIDPIRSQFVQFTRPFLTFSISAILKTKLAPNLVTIDDLAVKTSKNISIGTYADGSTKSTLSKLKKSIRNIRWLYNRMLLNESNLVSSEEEAVSKVLRENYAFLQEEPRNLYWAAKNCELKVLSDQNAYHIGQYGIAFHLNADPQIVRAFNQTIEKLELKGKLRRLKRKYFGPRCNGSARLDFSFTLAFTAIVIWLGW